MSGMSFSGTMRRTSESGSGTLNLSESADLRKRKQNCLFKLLSVLFFLALKGAQVMRAFLLSSSGPDPDPGSFLVHSSFILSHFNLLQFKIRRSGPGADAIFTVPLTTHHHR